MSIEDKVCDLWNVMPDEITEVYGDMNQLVDGMVIINNENTEKRINVKNKTMNTRTFEDLNCRATTSYTVIITPGEK